MRRVSIIPPEQKKSSRSRNNLEAYGRRKSINHGIRKSRFMSGCADDVDGEGTPDGRQSTKTDLNLDQVTANVKLDRLQSIFSEADQDGSPGLSLSEFKIAIRRTLNRDVKDKELELMFLKMDVNCDGTIDWEEYVTYNLLEFKERNQMIQMLRQKPFPNEMKEIVTRHHEPILRISFYPHINKRSTKVNWADGKYTTITRDGILSFWTIHMKHVRSFHVAPPSDRNTQPWYVDMACLYNNNIIAVASTDRDITLFDLSTKKFVRRYVIAGLEDCVTCMDCRADVKDRKHILLIWGDTAGNIYYANCEVQRGGVLFGTQEHKKDAERISFAELLRGCVPNAKAYKLSNVHDDWVCKIQLVPELNCILSCCQSNNTSLFMGFFKKEKAPFYFKVPKGLLCFDYCPILNVIATGGMDYTIRVWNPYVVSRAIVVLKGHTKPITQTILNGRRNMVISIDKGKTIKIHDLKDQSCLQHISGRIVKLGPFSVSACYFNRKLQQLIMATNELVMLEDKDEDDTLAEVTSHTKPIVSALYNETFNVIVSACEESVVSVWDINTGEKIMQFINAHNSIENGAEIPVDITAMAFDTGGRRIITGAKDGSVKVWNFNNGQCLQTFQVPDSSLITGIVSSKQRIYVTGWGRNVNIYVDGGGNESRKTWQTRHKEDILCIAYTSPKIIATGSYDGDIIIWSQDTGQMYSRLNAYEGVLPINDHFKKINDEDEIEEMDADVLDEVGFGQTGSFQRQRKSSFKDGSSPRRNTMFGLLGKVKEVENSTSECGSFLKRAENDKCEHPLLRAFDDTLQLSSSGKYRPRKRFSRDEYEKLCRSYEAAVDKILFLESRETMNKKIATLISAGAEGWIRAWSIHHQGGLLGQFNAAHKLGDSITAIATDKKNSYLFTGDTAGYIKVWDLVDYCTSQDMTQIEETRHLAKMKEKFTFLRVQSACGQNGLELTRQANAFDSHPPPLKSKPDKTVKTPRLLNSYRAHTRSITSINFVEGRELLITASTDCAIRLWTICGRYIGTFGEKWRRIPKVLNPNKITRDIPKELRRVGSARTLRVLNGGRTPRWDLAIGIMNNRGINQLKKQLAYLQKNEMVHTGTEAKLETSNILGKSYKRKVRHKLPPNLPKFIETPSTIAVYHSLAFVDLSPTDFSHTQEVLAEINKRRVFTSFRSSAKNKEKTGLISQFNKVVAKPVVGFVKPGSPDRLRKIVSRYQRGTSPTSVSPDMDDNRNTPASCPSTTTPSHLDSMGRSRIKLPLIE